jgi:hypothetical protein
MLVVWAPKGSAHPLGQPMSSEQPAGFHYPAFAMDPLGLNRVEPRALLGQQAAYDPHTSAAFFHLPVVRSNPPTHLFALMPACVVPDQKQHLLANRFELGATPLKKAGRYAAYRPSIHKTQPRLLKLGQKHPIAGDGLGVRVILGYRLLHQTQRPPRIAPTVLEEGLSNLLHQVSSSKPIAQVSELFSAKVISLSRHLFSLVVRIWACDPPLGSLPAHSHALQGSPDSLARDPLFGEPLLETDIGSHLKRP